MRQWADWRKVPHTPFQDREFGGLRLIGPWLSSRRRLLERGRRSQGRQSQDGAQRVDARLVGDRMTRHRSVHLGPLFGDTQRVGGLGQEPGRALRLSAAAVTSGRILRISGPSMASRIRWAASTPLSPICSRPGQLRREPHAIARYLNASRRRCAA